MLLDNDSVIRYMLRLGQAHMIRQSVRMLKQIHDSPFTIATNWRRRHLSLRQVSPSDLSASIRARRGAACEGWVISGLIPKSRSRTLFGAEGTRRLGNHRTLQKKLFIQNGVHRARHRDRH
jgi:hypothetical protein